MKIPLALLAVVLLAGCQCGQPPTMVWQPFPGFTTTPTPGLQYYQQVAPQMVPLVPSAPMAAPAAAPCLPASAYTVNPCAPSR